MRMILFSSFIKHVIHWRIRFSIDKKNELVVLGEEHLELKIIFSIILLTR